MTIHEAVLELREKVRDVTQQAFATELGVSISAVQKYEKDREPDVRSLLKLVNMAQQHKRPDLEEIFQFAIRDTMENAYVPANLNGAIPFTSMDEWKRMRAVQWAMQDSRFKDCLSALDEALDEVYKHMDALGKKRIQKAKEREKSIAEHNERVERRRKESAE